MSIWKPLAAAALLTVLGASTGHAQGGDLQAAAAQIVKADADFARSVADKNRQQFLSFIAEAAIFNGGAADELHGREAVIADWAPFFAPDGPTLTWAPTAGEVIGAGDLGYTTGRSVFSSKDADGKPIERRGQYITVWKKQADGSWKVIYDTGSTIR